MEMIVSGTEVDPRGPAEQPPVLVSVSFKLVIGKRTSSKIYDVGLV